MACLLLLSWRARRSGNNSSQFVLREVKGPNRLSAADCGWMTGNPEVISSPVGLVPTNALVCIGMRD